MGDIIAAANATSTPPTPRTLLGFTSRQLAISTPAPRILLLKLWRRANNNDVHAIYLWQGGNKYASSACN